MNAGHVFGLCASFAALGLLAAGCGGGSKAPPVASLETTTPAAGTSTASEASGSSTPNRAELATCMTAHGFPAVLGSAGSASNNSISLAGVIIGGNVNPNSPQFQSAIQACRKFLPGGGPPRLSQAQQAAAAKAMLAFATCMRGHGVPGFPDPDSQGTFGFGKIQAIDPQSPLVLTAFKACETLEPKVGPRIELGGGNVSERGG